MSANPPVLTGRDCYEAACSQFSPALTDDTEGEYTGHIPDMEKENADGSKIDLVPCKQWLLLYQVQTSLTSE